MLPLVALASVAWVAVILAAPLLPGAIGGPVYMFGAMVCHQIAERSFQVDGAQLPVCARCLGIYAGVAAGALLYVGRAISGPPREADRVRATREKATLLIAALPTILTVVLEWAGLWSPSNVTRAIAGAPLGAAVAFVTMRALHYEQCQRRRSSVPIQPSTRI